LEKTISPYPMMPKMWNLTFLFTVAVVYPATIANVVWPIY